MHYDGRWQPPIIPEDTLAALLAESAPAEIRPTLERASAPRRRVSAFSLDQEPSE